ncbi:MAG: fibronectin type III domain-containing protein [Candidatus Zixiibacteriota bacterium]|nr:MAG: fibronectin type III domain-containing protein [candidate division Zixibacteria bacterium]
MKRKEFPFKQGRRVFACLLVFAMAVLGLTSCSIEPKERLNPLDSFNPETGGDPFHLDIGLVELNSDTGSVEVVRLEWNNIQHDSLNEYHIWRRVGYVVEVFEMIGTTLPPQTTFIDENCRANTGYYYQIVAVLNEGRDSVSSDVVRFIKREL